MDLSNIFLYIAIGSVIISILWFIYISMDVKKEREVRRKKERDEKTKIKIEDLNLSYANLGDSIVINGREVKIIDPSKNPVISEQVLALMSPVKANVYSKSPVIKRAYFKGANTQQKYKTNLERIKKRIEVKNEELA